MDPSAILVTSFTVLVLILLVSGRVSLDAIGLGLIVALVATGLVDLEGALHGFANHAVITIGALYVVGEGLTRTGAVEFIARLVLAWGKGRESVMVLAIGLVSAALSAFLNNTAVVVVFIPVVIGIARDTGIPPSRLMIPMSFGSLFGGMCTLVGTSTNLLVDGVAVAEGEAPLGMFELSPIGVPLAVLCITFLAVFGKRLLPARASMSATLADGTAREYVTELVIGPASPLLGKTVAEAFGEGPRLLFLVRNEVPFWPPFENVVLEEGDVVVLRGDVGSLTDMQQRLGLKLIGNMKFDPRTMTFFELAVSPHSNIVGRRISDLHLWRDYNAVAVAVLRHGHHIRERVSNLVLRSGDLLLVCGEQASPTKFRASTDFFLLTGAHNLVVLRGHARKALAIAAGVVALFTAYSAFGWKAVPLPMAAVLGAMAMVATGCVTARRAYRTIDWPILIFVVGTLALGEAMRTSGTAEYFANGLVGALFDYGPTAVLAGIVFLCILFNAFVSHSAVAVLLTPIAIEVAHVMPGVDVRPFLLAVAFGGSIAFVTPQGHQVNLMVYGPGGYKYSDFIRVGIPVSLLAWAFVTFALAYQEGWL